MQCRRALQPSLLPTHHAPSGANLFQICKDLLPKETSYLLFASKGFQSLPRSHIAQPVGTICFRFAFICFPEKRRQQVFPSAQTMNDLRLEFVCTIEDLFFLH